MLINGLYAAIVGGRGTLGVPLYYLLLVNPLTLLEWLFPEPGTEIIGQLMQMSSRSATYPLTGAFSWLRFWHISLLAHILLAAAALWGASLLVNPLRVKRKIGRRVIKSLDSDEKKSLS